MASRGNLQLAAALALLACSAALLRPASPAPSSRSWENLIAPLRVGRPVVDGFVLSPPRRGEANDVVFVARRAADARRRESRVEIHIVNRGQWTGILETRSFGVAWEVPPPGSVVGASPEDSTAVTAALRDAIAANDSGFPTVDSVPLAPEPSPPLMSRVLERMLGARGLLIGTAVAAALVLLGKVRWGTYTVSAVLLLISLALRVPNLDLPFAHDQDVQRMLTGNSSLADIATGVGLQDRHPPLYFAVLHFAQRFGQSESAGRAPAVLSGALAAPAVFLAATAIRSGPTPAAALAGLAVAVSPTLVARSREVSGIPLYGLLLIAAAAALALAARKPTAANLAAVALSHAAALFTYYLAPFVVIANGAILWWRKAGKPAVLAFGAGVILGSPALVLAVATFFRDHGARETARIFPALAWGQHDPLDMASEMIRIAFDAFGPVLCAAIALSAALALARRDFAGLLAAGGVLATFAAVALLSPVARVQSYYFTSALPLAALLPALAQPRSAGLWSVILTAAVGLGTAPMLAGSTTAYLPDTDAFMPRFAAAVVDRPESTVVTVAHYDKTLLAYYLARLNGRSIAWRNWEESSKRIVPLAKVHSLRVESETELYEELDRIIDSEAVLVIERDAVTLPSIRTRLADCELLLEAPTGRLLACGADP